MALFDNWTPQWASSESMWSVESDVNFIGGAKLVLDSGQRTRHALRWDTVGTPSDTEVVIIAKTPSSFGSTGDSRMRPIVRGDTVNGNEAGYFVRAGDNTWQLISYNGDGTSTGLGTWGDPQTNTMYCIRLRANGSTIQAKTWEYGTDEPASWDASVTDSTNTSGWTGVGSYETYDEFGYVAAATGGGTAPLPSTIAPTPANTYNGLGVTLDGTLTTASTRTRATIIEDFEDQSLADYDGATGSWSFVQSPVYNGSYAISATNTSLATDAIRHQPDTHGRGDVIHSYHYIEPNSVPDGHAYFGFLLEGTGAADAVGSWDGYYADINYEGDELILWSKDTNLNAATSAGIPAGEWLRLETDLTSGDTITCTLYDSSDTQVAQASAVDSQYNGGQIGFSADDDTEGVPTLHDYVIVL